MSKKAMNAPSAMIPKIRNLRDVGMAAGLLDQSWDRPLNQPNKPCGPGNGRAALDI